MQLLTGPASCKTARFSYGQCNSMLERGLTKTVNRKTPVAGLFPPISATKYPNCTSATGLHSLYTPATSPRVSGVRLCAPPHECGSLREVMRWDRLLHTVRCWRWRRRPRPRPRGGEHLNRKLNPHPNPAAWSPSSRHRVQNVRFSLGLCTPVPVSRRTKCTFQLRLLHTHTGTGTCAKVFTVRRPFSLDLRSVQLGTEPFPLIPTQPESLYTPNDAKAGPGTRRPCETPHLCGPLREVFSGAFLVHTVRRRWRGCLLPRPRRG